MREKKERRKRMSSSILMPIAPSLHKDGWVPVLGNPDPMHTEPWGAALKSN